MINLADLTRGMIMGLSDQGAVNVTVRAIEMPERHAVAAFVFIADMVPPLQKYTLTLDLGLGKMERRAFLVPVAKLYASVDREREARRWSTCDL